MNYKKKMPNVYLLFLFLAVFSCISLIKDTPRSCADFNAANFQMLLSPFLGHMVFSAGVFSYSKIAGGMAYF